MERHVITESNCYSCNPLQTCQLSSRESKQYASFPISNVIKNYSAHIGGTDQLDNNVGDYRTNVRGNKLYFPIVTWLLEVVAQKPPLSDHPYFAPSITKHEFHANVNLQNRKSMFGIRSYNKYQLLIFAKTAPL